MLATIPGKSKSSRQLEPPAQKIKREKKDTRRKTHSSKTESPYSFGAEVTQILIAYLTNKYILWATSKATSSIPRKLKRDKSQEPWEESFFSIFKGSLGQVPLRRKVRGQALLFLV